MKQQEIAKTVADQIVRALESTDLEKWDRPWICENGLPTNATTDKPYQGTNILALWAGEISNGYKSNLWAGFKQWLTVDACVRKGEKSTTGIFFEHRRGEDRNGNEYFFPFMKTIKVFNAEQVDGFTMPEKDLPDVAIENPTANAVISATGAEIQYGGDRACYIPSTDQINLPLREAFKSTAGFYGVTFHELAHWSGAEKRLDRNLSTKFGDEAYAMEELVAELSAAITCLNLGMAPRLREDHAPYVKSWLQRLKNDTNAIFTASSKAQQATNYILAGGA